MLLDTVHDEQTRTGVKDKVAQVIIDDFLHQHTRLKRSQKRPAGMKKSEAAAMKTQVQNLTAELSVRLKEIGDEAINPLLRMPGELSLFPEPLHTAY